MTYNPQRALELLRIGSGRADATFREGQEDAIRHIVEGRGRLLVVQKTGWGKSFVYFIATKLLREAGDGPALLISPLLALMRNQIAAGERTGVRAATINSDNQGDWAKVEAKLRQNEVDILLIAPEKLGNDWFNTQVLAGSRRTCRGRTSPTACPSCADEAPRAACGFEAWERRHQRSTATGRRSRQCCI